MYSDADPLRWDDEEVWQVHIGVDCVGSAGGAGRGEPGLGDLAPVQSDSLVTGA